MADPADLEAVRRAYADELARVARPRSPALIDAFARAARALRGPGPWRMPPPGGTWKTTEDADPRRLYRDALVNVDPSGE